jgi:hypothetical protein
MAVLSGGAERKLFTAKVMAKRRDSLLGILKNAKMWLCSIDTKA